MKFEWWLIKIVKCGFYNKKVNVGNRVHGFRCIKINISTYLFVSALCPGISVNPEFDLIPDVSYQGQYNETVRYTVFDLIRYAEDSQKPAVKAKSLANAVSKNYLQK